MLIAADRPSRAQTRPGNGGVHANYLACQSSNRIRNIAVSSLEEAASPTGSNMHLMQTGKFADPDQTRLEYLQDMD